MIVDALRLAVGTLTILRTGAVGQVTRPVAGTAMIIAPVAVLPLAIAVGVLSYLGWLVRLPNPATALLMVALLALGTRALHLDGLADTTDGLGASWDRERALEVMRKGDIGPMGTVALIIVLGLQTIGFSTLIGDWQGSVLVMVLICCSRAAVTLACTQGIPPARPDGLGAAVAGSVPKIATVISWLLAAAALSGAMIIAGRDWWTGPIAIVLALAASAVLLRRATTRFGGITGDVIGACVELSLTVLLIAQTAP